MTHPKNPAAPAAGSLLADMEAEFVRALSDGRFGDRIPIAPAPPEKRVHGAPPPLPRAEGRGVSRG